MADNYLMFSEVIPQLTAAEEEWLKRQLEGIAVVDDVEHPCPLGEGWIEMGEPDKDVPVEEAEFAGCRAYRDMEGYDFGTQGYQVGFLYSFDDDADLPDGWGRHMWVYADEGGEIDLVAHLVQKFLCEFRSNDCWSLTYSTTCSRPRIGEFGGGAVFVTARGVAWENSYDFVAKRQAKFAAAQKRKIRK